MRLTAIILNYEYRQPLKVEVVEYLVLVWLTFRRNLVAASSIVTFPTSDSSSINESDCVLFKFLSGR